MTPHYSFATPLMTSHADGLIYDRWTLVNDKSSRSSTSPPLLGDVVRLREALWSAYPARKQLFRARRQEFRLATLRLYKGASFSDLPTLLDRLSHILLYERDSVSLHIRRGYVNYRLRFVDDALRDLDAAVQLLSRGADGKEGMYKPDVDALRARALVLAEMQCVLILFSCVCRRKAPDSACRPEVATTMREET